MESDELGSQLLALASELAGLLERIGRSSRNSPTPPPPSSDGSGFQPATRFKCCGCKRGGQPGHPESGPELLPVEQVEEGVEHVPDACRRCGPLLEGEVQAPSRYRVIEFPLRVFEHRLHRLVCRCCSSCTCATLPVAVEVSPSSYGLRAWVGQLGRGFPLSCSKIQAPLDQLLEVEYSCGADFVHSRDATATIREPIRAPLERAMQGGLVFARPQPVASVADEGLRAAAG